MPVHPAPRDLAGGRVRADRRAQTSDAVLPALTAAAVLLALFGVLRLLVAPPQELLVAVVLLVTAAVIGGVRLACLRPRTRAWVGRHADEVALGACLLASTTSFAELVVTGRPATAGGLMVFLLATGAILNHRRYSLVVTLVCLVQWLAVATAHGLRDEWAAMTALVVCAAVLARVLNALRCRAADRLATAEAAVVAAAVTDELSGLANRRGLLAAGTAVVRAADRASPVSCLYLDIDGLKATNDRFGHDRGDDLVRATAAALRSRLRPGDVAARLGGDEFALLLPGTSAAEAAGLAERLQADLLGQGVTASTGCSVGTGESSVAELLDAADAAMYAGRHVRRAVPSPRGPTSADPAAPEPTAAPPDLPAALPATGPDGSPRPGPVPPPAWVEPPASRTDAAALTRVGVWLHLALVPVHLLLPDAPRGPATAALSLAVAAVLAVLHRLAASRRTRRWSPRRAEVLTALTVLLVCAEVLLYARLVAEPWATLPVVLAVAAAGGILASRGLAVLVCSLTLAGWATLALAQPGTWTWSGSSVLSSVLVALLLHVTHQRTLDRLTAAQARVRQVSLTDELTGLPNRRGFQTRARPLVEVTSRRGGHLSLLYLDLDGLKQVIDARGHAAGDDLIMATADVLERSSGPTDVCARLGGDEFAVLLHDCPVAEVGDRVRWLQDALASAQVRASVGAAHLPEDATTLDGLLRHADQAMLRAKQAGRAGQPGRAQILGGRSS
ncbi:diguanylate cyclase domain-containing protein [Jannaschia sp. R86511]|uniref:diguanylate cyclase domain-containing protein n=1 Tax=Jannaschia sp. R86511 TaxID=3093853 RepID=UPI0036D3E9E1